DLFHRQPPGVTSGVLACASCHVEGGDDGQRRYFLNEDGSTLGYRRTQNLRGGLLETAPFHWAGDLKDIPALATDTLVMRMGAQPVGPKQPAAPARWLESIPLIPHDPPADLGAVERGEPIFKAKQHACIDCHTGAKFTSAENHDIGRGIKLQVPSLLGVGLR